ncbi:MAG: type III-A CRISPR-associated protein Cas10/Csm1 [Acholeplasmataceae bacterium]|jgi:CRISPR-associated protein Csm1
MDDKKHKLIVGALLHDIGKISFRAYELQGIKSHSIAGYEWLNQVNSNIFKLENIGTMIKYHHRNKMPDFGRGMREDDLAFIVSLADHISAGADRREKDDFDYDDYDITDSQAKTPLESVFSILKPQGKDYLGYSGKNLAYDSSIRYPEKDSKVLDSDYNDILVRLKKLFVNEELFTNDKHLNSLISIIKTHFKYLPSDTRYQMRNDISLAEHSLTTAAFASSLYDYFNEQGVKDYYEKWNKEKDLFKEKTFLFVSFDFSGIQRFVFDIPVEGALKNLRVRSFYLEMLAEIFVDSLLLELELSRANVIYVGGGHGYLILPNTYKAKELFKEQIQHFNNFFLKEFNYNLYLASSIVEVSPNDLISINSSGQHNNAFSGVMSETFKQTSKSKAQRFNFEVLQKLNSLEYEAGMRECSVCGTSNRLKKVGDKFICEICDSFLKFSDDLFKDDNIYYVVVLNKLKNQDYLLFPYQERYCYLHAISREEFNQVPNDRILFSYVKNDFKAFETQSTSIFVADYAVKDKKGQLSIGEIMKLEPEEMDRIAVMKLDVDSLGEVFKNRFPEKMYTISRMTSLSSHLSIYFKFYINELLKDFNITVIFSGGDDAFLMGTFKDILKFSKIMYESFKKYTLEKITISAGIGLFAEKYPIYKIANYTEDLLLSAKSMTNKNSVAIFDQNQVFKWDDFFEAIVGESSYLSLIEENIKNNVISKTMLYNSIYIPLKNIQKEDKKIIYKFAYMLGRRRSDLKDKLKDETSQKLFSKLEQELMISANYHNRQSREKLLLAIQIYMYLNRKKEE